MTQEEIKNFLEDHKPMRKRTLVIVDFSNVENWKKGLGWKIGIQELGRLTKLFSYGQKFLRRFYYGSDFGKHEKSVVLTPWSSGVINRAVGNHFEIVTKRVKYIHEGEGFHKKCDLDVEMAIDLIKEKDNYDVVVLFSGDGDLVYALEYLNKEYGKTCYVFTSRGHVGREIIDAKNNGIVAEIFYAEDFEYRLSGERFK